MENKRCSEQEYSGFDSEVIPHLNLLKNHALKMTRDVDDADDLLQDTLLKALRFFGHFEKGSNVKAWLSKIMVNTFINNYRKKRKQPPLIDYDDTENFYENIKADEVTIQHQQRDSFSNTFDDEITEALSVLSDNFRTIVLLCDIEGYSYQEISDFVDCPIGTVRSRIHRTRKILYAQLFEYAKKNGFVHSKINCDKKSETRNASKRRSRRESVSVLNV